MDKLVRKIEIPRENEFKIALRLKRLTEKSVSLYFYENLVMMVMMPGR